MRKLATLLVVLFAAPAHSQDADTLRELADREAIHEVMQQYIWSADSLDAEGYVAVFTEDGEIDSNGMLYKGHDQIRTVVTGMQERQAANRARGEPPGAFYHVVSNERISFQSPTEALYQSYWQTMRKGADNRYVAGGFGRSEDRLVKIDGKWLIKSRKLVVFTD